MTLGGDLGGRGGIRGVVGEKIMNVCGNVFKILSTFEKFNFNCSDLRSQNPEKKY